MLVGLFNPSSLLLAAPLAAWAIPRGSLYHSRHVEISRRLTGDVQLLKRLTFSSARWTFYDAGLGACGSFNLDSDFIVALNSAQYGGASVSPHCFKQITMTYNGTSTTATITDECPDCPYGGLSLSRGLFKFFAPESFGVIYGHWFFNEAGLSSSSTVQLSTISSVSLPAPTSHLGVDLSPTSSDDSDSVELSTISSVTVNTHTLGGNLSSPSPDHSVVSESTPILTSTSPFRSDPFPSSSDHSLSLSPPTSVSVLTLTSPLPSQSPSSSNARLGPVIGSAVGGIVLVILLAIIIIFAISKRRIRRRAQVVKTRTPTANPLLDNLHVKELAARNDLFSLKRPFDSVTGTQNQSIPSPSSSDLLQHQMYLMSQRIMDLEAELEEARAPPDYTSQASG